MFFQSIEEENTQELQEGENKAKENEKGWIKENSDPDDKED